MKSKKIAVILIAVAFMLVVVLSTMGLFTVKKVHVDFAVSESRNAEQIQRTLDGFVGSNLLFLNTESVKAALKDECYMEVLSIDKQYPNVINVKLKERREVYYLEYNGKYYVTTAEGFVLNELTKDPNSREKIRLDFDGIDIVDIAVGSYVKTTDDALLTVVFDMAKSVNLTDCIKTINIFKMGNEQPDVTFETYTGVKIIVEKANVDGKAKAIKGFDAYDKKAGDHEKMFSCIRVNKEVIWSEN